MKTINLDGFNEHKPSRKKEPKPLLNVDAKPVTTFVKAKQAFDHAESDLRKAKEDLMEAAALEFWRMNHARSLGGELPASTAEMQGDDCTAKITMARMYPSVSPEEVMMIVPKPVFETAFQQSFDFKIDGSKLNPETAGEFVSELRALVEKHRSSSAVTIKRGYQPTEQFHLERHRILKPEQNIQLQGVCPARIYVS
jgi:hypothetical protein